MGSKHLTVGARIAAIPILFVLAMVGTLYYTVATLQDQRTDSLVVETSGRQRGLNQRHMRETLMAARGHEVDLQKTRALFLDSVKALRDGGRVEEFDSSVTLEVPAAADAATRELLDRQAALFQEEIQAAGALLAAQAGTPAFDARLEDLLEKGEAVHAATLRHTGSVSLRSREKIDRMIRWEAALTLAATLLGLLFSFLLTRSITGPLERVVAAARRVAQGDLTHGHLGIRSQDELGQLARAFDEMQTNLRDLAARIRQITGSLAGATAQVLASSREQAAGVSEQLAAVQETTATMEEVGQAGTQIADRARQVGASAEAASTASASGLHAVAESSRTMESIREQVESVAEYVVSLSERTQAIGEIVATVDDIAERSTLLALNAAIEAASAGEEGSRFAVVAGELKSLADQSKDSTVQVRSILGEVQRGIHSSVMVAEEAVKRVDAGRDQARAAEATIRDMGETTIQSVQTFQQIAAATNQQQIGFEQVTTAMQNIRIASEQTAQGIAQLETAAGSMNELGQQLREAAERFQV